jgi:hypothetical protein
MTDTTVTTAAAFVLAAIRRDAAEGLYEDAGRLESFGMLHDYCDANDYIIEASEKFCPFPDDWVDEEGYLLWHGWQNEVADAVDTALFHEPVEVDELAA